MLELQNISKSYLHSLQSIEAVKDITLPIREGEFIAMVGPSGCGKSTLLKMIAGLIESSSGRIILDGREVISPDKDRGLVFQGFTLFPWLTVRQNIGFGLSLQKLSEQQKSAIVEHYLKITDLGDFADFYPKDLSGGMQQRVAIARTLANNPKVLLMDEPFGALDSQTRSQMQEFLTNLWEQEHKTVIFITHDVQEAIFLSDRILVLSGKPVMVHKEIKVPFPHPRSISLMNSIEFSNLRGLIRQAINNH